ncbi:unnamed protein product [Rotaria sp. Silwood1]|nr:unnamed protein product [Rotaria sp. Silwood1]
MSLLHLEYRLVPEHPLPAAVDDALALYRALLRNGISSSRLIIMGDSAGGGLTLLTVQALLDRNLPIPRAVITISPWTDLSLSVDISTTESGYTLSEAEIKQIRQEARSSSISMLPAVLPMQ